MDSIKLFIPSFQGKIAMMPGPVNKSSRLTGDHDYDNSGREMVEALPGLC
jgi:hypothetical protein